MMQVVRKRKKKKATEGLILAAQEQALRNHSVRIDKTSETSLFRLCGNSTEEYDMFSVDAWSFPLEAPWKGDSTVSLGWGRYAESMG